MIYTVTLNPSIDRTLHFPTLTLGTLNRASQARLDLSGKGVNVSVALRQMGLESMMLLMAAGGLGHFLVNGLREQGYAVEAVMLGAGECRSNVTVIDLATGVTTKLNEPGPKVTAQDLDAFETLLRQHLTTEDVCIFAGSLPPGAPSDTYARLVRVTQGLGATAVLDSSGPAMTIGCGAAPQWIKPNDVEAAEIVGGNPEDAVGTPQQIVNTLNSLLALGPANILLTLGARGAVLACRDPLGDVEIWWGRPPQIDELSAVGAGDASLAGAVASWLRGECPEEIIRWAVASGTATAIEDGSHMPALSKIESIHGQVSVVAL